MRQSPAAPKRACSFDVRIRFLPRLVERARHKCCFRGKCVPLRYMRTYLPHKHVYLSGTARRPGLDCFICCSFGAREGCRELIRGVFEKFYLCKVKLHFYYAILLSRGLGVFFKNILDKISIDAGRTVALNIDKTDVLFWRELARRFLAYKKNVFKM